jgi:hypothetical protein
MSSSGVEMDEAAIYAMMADAKKQKPKQQGAAKKGKMSKTAVSEEERRNMVLLGVKKKKECEAKALNVVEKLADPGVDREWLRDAVCLSGSYNEIPINIKKNLLFQCRLLHPGYYQDATEERTCDELCGYPLCDAALGEKAKTTKKYHISARDKRVYDLTERKNFCSDLCFKASNFLKAQGRDSPIFKNYSYFGFLTRFLNK